MKLNKNICSLRPSAAFLHLGCIKRPSAFSFKLSLVLKKVATLFFWNKFWPLVPLVCLGLGPSAPLVPVGPLVSMGPSKHPEIGEFYFILTPVIIEKKLLCKILLPNQWKKCCVRFFEDTIPVIFNYFFHETM